MTSKEALEDIILYLNATEPQGLYCENIEVIKQELERLEQLEKENQELNSKYNALFNTFSKQIEEKEKLLDSRVKYIEENEKLKKAIEILKSILDIYIGDGKAYIDCCVENPIITLDLHNDKDFKLYELLKEVLENGN